MDISVKTIIDAIKSKGKLSCCFSSPLSFVGVEAMDDNEEVEHELIGVMKLQIKKGGEEEKLIAIGKKQRWTIDEIDPELVDDLVDSILI